jgi:hypothetical protein
MFRSTPRWGVSFPEDVQVNTTTSQQLVNVGVPNVRQNRDVRVSQWPFIGNTKVEFVLPAAPDARGGRNFDNKMLDTGVVRENKIHALIIRQPDLIKVPFQA